MKSTYTFAVVLLGLLGLDSLAIAAIPTARLRQSVSGDAIRFVYRSYEGDVNVVCKHRLASADSPFDWRVECSDGKKVRTEYVAHIALSAYPHNSGTPALSIELLYWLTSGTRLQSEMGSTTWMHFAAYSPLLEVSSSQTIENGTVGLYLEMNVGKMQARLRSTPRSH